MQLVEQNLRTIYIRVNEHRQFVEFNIFCGAQERLLQKLWQTKHIRRSMLFKIKQKK